MATKEKKAAEETVAAAEEKKETNVQLDQVKAFFTEQMSKLDAQVKDISKDSAAMSRRHCLFCLSFIKL